MSRRRAARRRRAFRGGALSPSRRRDRSRGHRRLRLHMPRLAAQDELLRPPHGGEEDDEDRDEQVPRPVQFTAELAVAARREPSDRRVGERPQDRRGRRPREESAVAHGAHAHDERHERVQHREEPRDEDRRSTAPVEVALGAEPVLLAQAAAEPRSPDMGPNQRPRAKPIDSPMSAPTTTTTASAKYSPTLSTAVAATITIVSPGTTSPMSTEVSRRIPRPAMSVRRPGPPTGPCRGSRRAARSRLRA